MRDWADTVPLAVHDPWLVTFLVMALLLVLGVTSGLVNSRLWMSEPLVCLIGGVLLSPAALDLVHLDPAADNASRAFLREAARITLGIAVLAAAIRLPRGWLRRNWRGMAVMLGPGMVLMWLAGTAVTAVTLGLPLLTCVLVGAIVAPTDPVLSAPVVTGSLAVRAIPAEIRHAITAESGVNDGLAAPLVALPMFLIVQGADGGSHALENWGIESIVISLGSAIVLGGVLGFVALKAMRWAQGMRESDRSSLLTIALALALATLAGLQTIGGDGVLGAFVAGAVLNEGFEDSAIEHQEHFNEAIGRFFDLPIMFLLGCAAPWAAWWAMGWHAAAFAIGLLLFRRMPAWLLLRRWMPWAHPPSHALFVGWFGPVGAAALFYACEAEDITGIKELWPIVSLAAVSSVVLHGVTGTHLSALLGRVRERHGKAAK